MPPMRVARPVLAPALGLLAAAVLLSACGGDSETTDAGGSVRGPAESRPAPPKAEFPSTAGRSLEEVLKLGDKPSELKLEPAAMVFYPGRNRYPFAVLERDGTQVTDAEVALYLARVPAAEGGAEAESGSKGPVASAEKRALEEPAIGPFPARIESLATDPDFRAQTSADGPDTAAVIYSTELAFPSAGGWRIAALVKEDGELGGALLPGVAVGEFESIPQVGEKAPLIHTPTAADANGDLSQVTTRVPPDTQNKVDYADVLGKEPIVLLFATPQFCQSRVCGPVVDQTEQAQREYGDEAAFIHMEIYNQNDPGDGVRPQVRAFHLPSEPWLFTIDRAGVVRETVEGPFGAELLDEAIEKAIR
jgi:hypothetical protein